MKKEKGLRCGLVLWLLAAASGDAALRYVDLNSATPTRPYTTWSTAALTIQDAIDAAASGDEIVVTNGCYATGGMAAYGTMTNRVAVTKPVKVRSVNGPQFTIIEGRGLWGGPNPGDGAIRCVYLTNGAGLAGFTLTNGATRAVVDDPTYRESSGGGVWCESTNAVVSDCVITGNTAYSMGGGVYMGTLNDCIVSGNAGGGAASAVLNHCTITGNLGSGASLSTLNRCTVTANTGTGANQCLVYNSLLTRNGDGGARLGVLNNCTLTSNTGGGASGSWWRTCTLNNCIVYYNTPYNTLESDPDYQTSLNYSCTVPMPLYGVGNITSTPLFADRGAGNFRLLSNSPCVNVGNLAAVRGSADLDGRPRTVGTAVDIGAYEFQPGIGALYIGWLQQYGLPTDGSADTTDTDADTLSNLQEYIAGTNPADALSVLRIETVELGGPGGGLVIMQFNAVSNRSYTVQGCTALSGSGWSNVAHVVAQPSNRLEAVTNRIAPSPGPGYYRLVTPATAD